MFFYMPAPPPPIHAHPAKPFYTLRDAARDGRLIVMRCYLCSRCVHFLATDLVEVLDPSTPMHLPPFKCSRCKTDEHIGIRLRSPHPGEIGSLPIRRPAGFVRKWRTEMLGDT